MMRQTDLLRLCALLLSVSCSSMANGGQEDPPLRHSGDFRELELVIERELQERDVPGVSLAIIRDGAVVYRNAFGVSNIETGAKLTPETVFEAASLSKPVFAYFTMLQVEEGLLELDRPLYEYLPHQSLQDDPRHKLITARMVLAHASGLPNWRDQEGGGLDLMFTPGTRFQYSGEGYEYLEEVLKRLLEVDDKGLQALLQSELTQVTGAKFMQFTWDDSLSARKAYGHRGGVVTDNHFQDTNFGAAYSLHTTPSDYAMFLIELLRPSPGNEEAAEALLDLQAHLPNEQGEMHRSLGFPVKLSNKGVRYYHSGNNGDFRAYCHFYLDSGDGIVLFGNSDNLFSSGLAESIVEHLGHEWFYM